MAVQGGKGLSKLRGIKGSIVRKAKKIEAFLFSELQPWIIHGVIDRDPLFHLREQKICHLQKQCSLQ
jgi:hypothetical protein